MEKKYKIRQTLKLLLISFCLIICGKSFAENTTILEDVTPTPSTFESDYTNEPEVIITKEAESTIEEYRLNGHLYMIKITPDGAPPYYLYKETLGGAWTTFHGVEEPLIVPQWVAYEF